MPLSRTVPCKLELKPVGWWLTFPSTPSAGLLLTDEAEQIEFARDCGIDLHPSEFSASWFFAAVESCPPYWFDKAKFFKIPNF
jgi:hypothetical protein